MSSKPGEASNLPLPLSKVNSIPGDASMFPHSDWYVQVSLLEIFVQVMHQEIITLEVDSSDTIGSLKEKIKDKKGFPAEEQLLFFQREELKDDRTVSDYNIQNKSTVILSLQIYRLEVTILSEGTRLVTLEVNPTDSILELKREIQNITGVPPKEQSLRFDGIELKNERTIFEYNIQNKSYINLVAQMIKVYVLNPLTQERITLVQKPRDTIGSVKDNIYAQTKISSDRQVLQFNGRELDDGNTLKCYNIQSESQLFLYEEIIIFVEMLNGTAVTLKLCKSNTIEDVKVRLDLREDIPWNMQRLSFRGKLLRDSDTLRDLNIRNNSILRYVVMIRIHIKMPNESQISVDVNLDDNIRNVRDRIQSEGGIPSNQLCLSFRGKLLRDSDTLRDLNIRNNSILRYVVMIRIHIKMPNESQISVDVNLDDNIRNVRDRIQSEGGIPSNQLCLSFRGKLLRDSDTLRDLNIRNNSILRYVVMIRIHIKMPNESQISVDVNLDDNIRNVRDRIQSEGGIPSNQLCLLMYDGEELNDSYTLRHYKLRSGSILSLVKSGGTSIYMFYVCLNISNM